MNSIRKKNVTRIHIISGYVYACLIIIVVHLFFIKYISHDEAKKDLISDAEIGARLVSNRIGDYIVLSEHAAVELSGIGDNPEENALVILDSFVKSDRYEEVFLISADGKMYRHNGQQIPLSEENFNKIKKQDSENAYTLIPDITEQREHQLMIVEEVIIDDQLAGYFAGCFGIENIFREMLNEYLKMPAAAYIVDTQGNVIAQNETNALPPEFAELDNLLVFIDGMNTIEGQVTALKRLVGNAKDGDVIVEADGTSYGFIVRAIPNMKGYMYLTILPKSDYMREVVGKRKAEVFLIFFDMIAIIAVALVVHLTYKRREDRLKKVAYIDTVTNAYTKAYLREFGQRLLDEEDIPFAIVAFDIVGFRYVNELFGHERGDEILRVLAENVKGWFGSKEILSRNTADFFEAIIADPSVIEVRLGLLSEQINSYARGIDVTYPIKIRAGYVKTTKSNRNLSELLDKANSARKTINENSSVLVAEYTRDMQDEIKRRDEISAAKESAMEHGEFKVFLQPKFDVKTGQLAGAEALIRWIKRDGSMVFPDQFIPVFESDGYIEKVDFYMLESVCKLLKRLEKDGYKRVPISVNQSRVLLLNPEYIGIVLGIFEKYDVPKRLLELELTETAFFDDQNRMISIMTKLREEGCVIDIDDFGSGYSSLNMIKDIPFDILKIDRGFFGEISTEKGVIILERVVEMASSIGVKCVCEGVETKEQEQLLRDIGCAYAQGYLYSKPIPAEEFIEKFMTKENE